MESNLFIGISLTIIATLIGSVGALFFKYASKDISKGIVSLLKNYFMYFGFVLYGLASLLFVFALKFGELSIFYPISGLNYVWVSFLSIKYLDEKMNDFKWLGVFMIFVGAVLIGFGA